jgi:lipopolysaccharide transport system permease protein
MVLSTALMREYVISPRALSGLDVKEVWASRELFVYLTWRDILLRYKQTVLGVLWALLQPLLTAAVLTLVFGRIAQMDPQGVPYPLIALTGLLPWTLFSSSLTTSSNSLVNSANIITKVYFPRLLVPISAACTGIVDFVVSFIILLALLGYYGMPFRWTLLLMPLLAGIVVAVALSLSLWLSALNLKYRDVRHAVPFFTNLGLYVSPVGFLSSAVPERYRLCYSLNPMTGVIDVFRWCVLGDGFRPDAGRLAFPAALVVTLLLGGMTYFRRCEREFADVI